MRKPHEFRSRMSAAQARGALSGGVALSAADLGARATLSALEKIGIGFGGQAQDSGAVMAGMGAVAQDDAQGMWSTASNPIPAFKLQTWVPGFVSTVTKPLKAEKLVGRQVIGRWFDNSIVIPAMEPTYDVGLYSDESNVPYVGVNPNFNERRTVRFEVGMQMRMLEEAQAGEINMPLAAIKRKTMARALRINENKVAFSGYNSGAGLTYGILNDPNLPGYVSVTGPAWTSSSATFATIQAQIREAIAALVTQSGGLVDATTDAIKIGIPTGWQQYLTISGDFNVSVEDWIAKNYKGATIEEAPQFVGANGGANVFYVYAERADTEDDGSTDGGETWLHAVQALNQTIGAVRTLKGYEEAAMLVTAGVTLKRPWAIVRRSGI